MADEFFIEQRPDKGDYAIRKPTWMKAIGGLREVVADGARSSRWSKPGTEPHRRTSLAVDPLRGSGDRAE